MNDFEKFAVSNGIGTNKLDGYNKYIVKNGIISPTILEERSLNVIGLDIFSRLQYDRILFLGTAIDEDVANIINAQLLYLNSIGDDDIKMFIKTTINVLTMHIQEICGAMWFLRCLLTIVIFFIWIRFISGKVMKGKFQEEITVTIVVAMALFSQTFLCPDFFKINLACYYLIFYYIGYVIRKYDITQTINKYKCLLLILGLGLNVCVAMRFTYAIGGYSGGLINLLRFVLQIIGSIMVLAMVQWENIADSKLLNEIIPNPLLLPF